jgi:3,4-dihydroxy-2-butanone 4-phosphate synthase
MVADIESMRTAFTVSVHVTLGTTTGVSAAHSATGRALADALRRAGVFARLGHIFPLRVREGGGEFGPCAGSAARLTRARFGPIV